MYGGCWKLVVEVWWSVYGAVCQVAEDAEGQGCRSEGSYPMDIIHHAIIIIIIIKTEIIIIVKGQGCQPEGPSS